MNVADAVGRALAAAGVRQVFGVIGSGNFHLTNAMVAGGAQFVAARHEGGAATMADAYSRMSGTVAAVSVHQGCGLTNAMTGITEAAKSRTPMIIVAAEVTEPRSNFYVDQEALARSVGAVPVRITSAETAVAEAMGAVATAVGERRTVLLNVPLSLQALETEAPTPAPPPSRHPVVPDAAEAAALTDLLHKAERPVFVAGRGSRGQREPLELLAERSGALLATSAVAHGLFDGNPWSLGISGGFASPRTAELIRDADLIVGWGCALNMWTMRHGQLINPDATVVQVDDDTSALGAHREIQLGVTGDVELTATAVLDAYGEQRVGYRSTDLGSVRWRDVAFDDESTGERIDPRTLSLMLDDLLPAERVIAVDSGNFMGYPSVCLSVPDENGLCFTQAFQSVGLGLATAIGAALAQPDRLPVAVLGDGGALMSAAELDTVRRLGLPMLVVVYNDDAYGAEVHHFGPGGHPLDTVTFPPTDIAAIGRGYGFEAVTVRTPKDLAAVEDWLNGPRSAPMLVDAKVVADHPSWWLEEAFRGH
jgi:acetolactate synthase I/II/III large subunit